MPGKQCRITYVRMGKHRALCSIANAIFAFFSLGDHANAMNESQPVCINKIECVLQLKKR